MDRLLTAIGRLLIVLFWLISIWMIVAGAYSVYGHTIGLEKYDVAFETIGSSIGVIGFGFVLGIGMHLLMKWIWIKK